MIRRKTTPLLASLTDRVSLQPQLLLPIRTSGSKRRLLLLQFSQLHKPASNSYFACDLHRRGLGTAAQLRPDPELTVEATFSCEEEKALSSLSTSPEPSKAPSFLSSHNFYTEPPTPTAEESSEVSILSKQLTFGTSQSEPTMDQIPFSQELSGGWPSLNPTAQSFEVNLNPSECQTLQQPPAQSDPAPGPANNQSPSHKKKKKNRGERKNTGEGDYLTPRQRRKAGQAEFQQQAGPSPVSNNSTSSTAMPQNPSLPPNPPPGLPQPPPGLPLNARIVPSRPQPGPNPTLAPSRASGGIPNPSPSYLQRASFPPSPSPQPRPLLLVIDLNGTLLHRPSSRKSAYFVRRPNAEKFLRYCIDTFSVVIWSSARPENVTKMCDTLLTEEQKGKVLAIWGRDKFGLSPGDYNRKVQVYKRLTSVWRDERINSRGFWHQGNTVLIDDSVEKARSEPYNAVTIPEFLGDVKSEEEGGREWVVLPAVHEYLNGLAMTQDVSRFIRERPFRVEMI